MIEKELVETIETTDLLDTVAGALGAVADTLFPDTETAKEVEDVLHGKPMGHPLHPPLTDIPVGAWTVAMVLDLMDGEGREKLGAGADAAIAIGLAGAAASAVTGLADWKYTEGRSRRLGAAHAASNSIATVLYGASLAMRKNGSRSTGKWLSAFGYAAVMVGGMLGGELAQRHHLGTNFATMDPLPEDWVKVIKADSLAENTPTRADADGMPVVLVKRGNWISALAARCSHMGGPLDEGKLEGECLRCPWHDSSFHLDDGAVVDGPAAYPQPVLETRIWEGMVEVRRERPA